MIPSPKSSLSSFRDYYQHHSEYSSYDYKNQDHIGIGFRNFQLLKLLSRLDWRLREKQYWNIFWSFRKLTFRLKKSDRRALAHAKFRNIIVKQSSCSSKIFVKCQFLKELMQNMNEKRQRQVKVILKLGLWFAKRYQVTIASNFHSISLISSKQEQPIEKDKARYIKKLAKALLCIVFRNIMHLKFKRVLEIIKKSEYLAHSRNNNIRFFKPKKQRLVYEHKVDQKINKLSNFIIVYKWINKKICQKTNYFMLKIKSYQPNPLDESKEGQGDSLDIMTNVVKHMVYLTARQTDRSQQYKKSLGNRIKALKLKYLIYKMQLSHRKQISLCLLHWREVANQSQFRLIKQISRLQHIKQGFIQDL